MPIPLIKVPRFTMILPFSGKEVEYRPFLVKEEKVLLMAKDSEDHDLIVKTVGDIVRDCTDGVVDANRDPMFDVQYAFLQIRGKSVGEDIEFYLICGECAHKVTTITSVNDFTLLKQFGHSNIIDLDGNTKLTMKYPTFAHFRRLFELTETEQIYDVVADCIDTMVTDEEVIKIDKNNHMEVRAFLDNLLPEQYEKIENFFTTMPVLQYYKEYVCEKCERVNAITINGINNFFV